MMKPIRSVKITFVDGTTRDIFVEAANDEGFYKSEELLKRAIVDHTVYVVNGRIRDTPAFGIE